MTRVITYGTFDIIHEGHINILRRARAMGDFLIVGLSTENFNQMKNKKAFHTYEQRKIVLQAIRYVDWIIPEKTWEQKIDDVKQHGADIFVMGDDWKGEFDFLKPYCEVIYLPRTQGISTTKIKNDLHRLYR